MRAIDEKRERLGIPIMTFCAMCNLNRSRYYQMLHGSNFNVDALIKMLAIIDLQLGELTEADSVLYIDGVKITKHDSLMKRVECWEYIEELWKKGVPFYDIEVAFQLPRGTLSKKLLKEQEKDLYKIKMMI